MVAVSQKPVFGFGWVGWSSIVVGALIVTALFLGVDLQFATLRAVYAVGDWPLVYWFVTRPFSSMSITLFDPLFGPFPLVGFLIACRVCSRRVPVWQQWLTVGVALWGSTAAFSMYPYTGAHWGMGNQVYIGVYEAFTLMLACLFSWIMFRDWRITLAFLLAIPLPLMRQYAWSRGWATPHFFSPRYTGWIFWFDQPVFIFLTLVVPIWWAVNDRRKCTDPDLACIACGYSREGLAGSTRCPECGTDLSDAESLT